MLLILLSISFATICLGAEEKVLLRPFKTDGCTGWFDQSFKYDWKKCCVIHDLYFWAGGEKSDRKNADKKLRQCVKEVSNGFHAGLIYFGVKTGSLSPFKIPSKKWGNAWDEKFNDEILTSSDISKIKESLAGTINENPDLEEYISEEVMAHFYQDLSRERASAEAP